MLNYYFVNALVYLLLSIALTLNSKPIQDIAKFKHQTLVTNLNHPWGMVFLDKEQILISERNGELVLYTGQNNITLETPIINVFAQGQGGLLDLALHPNYKQNGWIYLVYSYYDDKKGATTALARFKVINNQLKHWQDIYIANAYTQTSYHFGGRIAFDDKGYLYLTIGDRGKRHQAQNTNNDIGTVLRLYDDGRLPKDNPFNNAIYSYGHRNPQGLIFTNKELIVNEHGPRGGDEINIISKGVNYGWPVIGYGREYVTNIPIGTTHKAGMEQPNYYWVPSIAPSGFAKWQDKLLIGSLKFSQLVVLDKKDKVFDNEKRLFSNQFGRIRDVAVYNGAIYLLIDAANGKLIKLSPS